MSERLASWLIHNESTIVPRWARHVRERGVSDERIATADLRSMFFVQAYAGLIEAARGDYAPLSVALDGAARLRGRTDHMLPRLLEIPFQLRRVIWDLALHDERSADALQTLAELEPLTEWIVDVLARQFGQQIEHTLRQRIEEAEFMATQLDLAAQEAEGVALRLSRLYTFAQALNGSLQLHDVLGVIGDELQHALGTDRCAIWLRADHHLFHARSWGYPQPLATERYAIGDASLVPQALRRSTPWLLPDPAVAQDGGWVDPDTALLALPLLAGNDRLGVIVVQGAHDRLTAEQITLAQSLTSQAALALENARLYDQIVAMNAALEQRVRDRTEELRTERDRLDLLYAVSSTISSTLDIDTLLADLLQVLAQRLDASHGSVLLLDSDTDQLVRRASLGGPHTEMSHFPLGVGVAGWVAAHKEPVLIDDVQHDARWIEPDTQDQPHKRTGALLAVPLITSDELIGVLILSHPDIGYFRAEHQRLLTVVANEIAGALRNAELYNFISEQATRLAAMVQTERYSSSQSQAILQSIADGVVVCDCDGQIMLANAMSAQILEQPVEELSLLSLHDVLRALNVDAITADPLRDLLLTPRDERGQPRQFRTTLRIGPRSIDIALGPVLTERDDLLGGVAILRDITREMESDRLKTEFIGTVSHELRTPMTVIKGYLQLLTMGSMGALTPTQRQLIDTISANAERMTAIINDLLDITKIESGSVEIDLQPVNVLDAITMALNGQDKAIRGREHTLLVDISTDTPHVRADRGRLQQILDNLLSNAIKYTPKGGTITVTARGTFARDLPPSQQAGLPTRRPYVLIEVIDTGIGIDRKEHERIFERFHRIDTALKVEAGGTGLGLAIVRPLVHLMGGRIWVTSEPQGGSTFSMLVPTA